MDYSKEPENKVNREQRYTSEYDEWVEQGNQKADEILNNIVSE